MLCHGGTSHPKQQTAPEAVQRHTLNMTYVNVNISCFDTYHVHGVTVDEFFSRESIEAVHELLFVQQEGLKSITEATAIGYTVLVHVIQLPDHCTRETQHEKTFRKHDQTPLKFTDECSVCKAGTSHLV